MVERARVLWQRFVRSLRAGRVAYLAEWRGEVPVALGVSQVSVPVGVVDPVLPPTTHAPVRFRVVKHYETGPLQPTLFTHGARARDWYVSEQQDPKAVKVEFYDSDALRGAWERING